MKLIACLGNPGKKYGKNRHNAGFIIGSALVKEFAIRTTDKLFSSISGNARMGDADTLLLFPQTYMNNSGEAVRAAMQYYREIPENLVVIHDEIELPFGDYRTKFSGGHKGHNGLRSIIQHVGTADFHRLRIGVGRPGHPEIEVADYVLSSFTEEEWRRLDEIMPQIIIQLLTLLR